MERTCIIIKPDGVKRNLIGEIINRLEGEGLGVRAIKMINAEVETLRKHYAAHIDKHFYKGLEEYLMEGPIIAMVFEGFEAIEKARELTGHTDPSQASKGTVRGDLGEDSIELADREKRSVRNLIHASGTKEEAESEIKLWFKKEEILK
ncbi:MAG: nucleoside-diphosphate kinase [Candidatus Aenigmarchaeota archaeon]|nr:nucleoside-diphosphate kinase [Candidatus Aenigmarchaeota archaeon]NIP40994.1 nucleoside-diphosphate kinase [Candidatus Aenigmarchaeota archaeon]NIQ17353.1 nucleoside-diphosphate kinase [Candidatus Aenigmarchaeota archaeon]NIS73315.1 nucleoside-diphosphate kinase [Candidatus Aenigmarchaeota archaeon]